ncbi:MAG: AsmA-like C-terminal region-containing protein, partial [Pseudomonadota bacterium]
EAARAKLEAEAKAHAEEEARQKAEAIERAREEAEKRARELDEEDVRARAEAAARSLIAAKQHEAEAAAQAVKHKEKTKLGKPILIGLLGLIASTIALVHFIPFTAYIPDMERIAAQALGEPVSIGDLHAALLPTPHFTLDNVAVGIDKDIRAVTVTLTPDFGTLSEPVKVVDKIELETVTAEQSAALRAAHWLQDSRTVLEVHAVTLKGVKLSAPENPLPVFDADFKFTPTGELSSAWLRSSDDKFNLRLSGKGNEQLEVNFSARNWAPPLEPAFNFDNLTANGTWMEGELQLRSIEGQLYGGSISGSASARNEADGITASSQLEFKHLTINHQVPLLLHDILASGELSANLSLNGQAREIGGLLGSMRMEGSFVLKKGTLANIDLVRALQSPVRHGVHGGQTRYNDLEGSIVFDGKRTQYRQLRLTAGALSASGAIDVAPNHTLSGRLSVELGSSVKATAVRGNLGITGVPSDPALYPANKVGAPN